MLTLPPISQPPHHPQPSFNRPEIVRRHDGPLRLRAEESPIPPLTSQSLMQIENPLFASIPPSSHPEFVYSSILDDSLYGHNQRVLENPKSLSNRKPKKSRERTIERVNSSYLTDFRVPKQYRPRFSPESPLPSTGKILQQLQETLKENEKQFSHENPHYKGIPIEDYEQWLFHGEKSERLKRLEKKLIDNDRQREEKEKGENPSDEPAQLDNGKTMKNSSSRNIPSEDFKEYHRKPHHSNNYPSTKKKSSFPPLFPYGQTTKRRR